MNAVCTYDFTVFNTTVDDVKKLMRRYCKSWDFQLEKCPTTDKLHFQGRMSLKVKERMSTLIKKFPGYHLSITSAENADNDWYVTKEDTRIEGPWSSTDIETYIPRQVREIKELRIWQQEIIDNAKVWDTRTINVIVDPTGNNGKTTLCTYVGVHKLGRQIPFSNDFRDIMRMIMGTPTTSLYLFDIPRALKKDHLFQFFAGIETIKNGYAYDDRYRFTEKYFDCPNIWIFMNVKPDISYLSNDRWKFWKIIDHRLVADQDNVDQADDVIPLAI